MGDATLLDKHDHGQHAARGELALRASRQTVFAFLCPLVGGTPHHCCRQLLESKEIERQPDIAADLFLDRMFAR